MAETPTYALVMRKHSRGLITLTTLDHLDLEIKQGAWVLGREDEECMPYRDEINPSQSNPRRDDGGD